jgi:glutaredoxin
MIPRMKFLVLLFMVSFAAGAQAQLYRWVDEQGKVHFGDSPPPRARDVKKGATPPPPAEQFELAAARKNNPITLYSAPECGPTCNDARALLNKRGVPFTEISVTDNEKIEQLKKVAGEARVPTLLVGSTVQKGYSASVYDGLLDSAGYPKAGILPARSQPSPEKAAEAAAKAEEEQSKPTGPYAPGAAPSKQSTKGSKAAPSATR